MAQRMPFEEVLHLPPLYAILNLDSAANSKEYAERLLESGVNLLQIRAKEVSDAHFLHTARKLRELTTSHGAKLIINDRPDICLLSHADGVHLGQDDISPNAVRAMLGDGVIIGYSTHNAEQFYQAPIEVLDYIALGPIFNTKTKPGANPVVGLENLRKLAADSPLPLVAIGGIDADNCAEVFAAGAVSVAVVGDLERAVDLRRRVAQFDQR